MTGFSSAARRTVRERSKGWCERCGAEPATQYHHRRCRGMGSTKRPESNQPANCLHLCIDCHRDIEQFRRQALESGWLVSQQVEPASVSVLYRGRWVLLDDLGNMREAS